MDTTQRNEQVGGGNGPGRLSRWIQRTMNARTNRKIRGGRGRTMGMDLLILHTVGRRSGQRRETPLAWYPDGADSWVVVASGGGDQHPDWFANLVAHPDRASVELPGRGAVPVVPHRLDGADREKAWQHVTAAQPRMAKYQAKSTRAYPLVRLTARPAA